MNGDDTRTHPESPVRLEQINRLASLARLVAGLAHEVNNSLQVVGGLVELLADRRDLPPDVLARIGKIGTQSDKATAAIRQVLGYAREMPPARTHVDLVDVVEQVFALRRYALGRAVIAASMEGPPATRPRVPGDPRALLQVVLNLVLDAEEALANQPERRLLVSIRPTGTTVRIAVGDSGTGVPEDIRDRIFEPYFTTRATERSLGLGLPVARSLVALHGGQLTLEDARQGHTTFVAELPATP